ncbi:SMI1/KNR4 family protein [Clostridium felsineum]|uniref:Uncharacterized protein n=1 Tax=Clostridium felsineum TaxID=36839 RepID=A0A1S8L6T7_9CLOT|nr:SMI1/KNR4 family protein [Clostridium felsineum]URZ08858.1 hypothetical protein CLROS_042520 [Clostridium felsineum]URZ09486.1 hypothetical protein CROST_001570 [Clostridium felsineum]
MKEKVQFLRRYHKNIQLLNWDEIDTKLIPSEWLKVFKEKDTKERIKNILSIWEKSCGVELRNTIAYLYENTIDIDLVEYDGRYLVLYSIKTSDGEIEYYVGGNPNEKFNNPKLQKVWSKFPDSIRRFYETVHNGFYYYASESMGLVPIQSVTFFDDDEWGIIEDLEEPLQINLETTFGFFKSGMGGYVAVDHNNCDNNNATLWFSNSQPRYNIDFWDIVDEWIVIGFE